MGFFNKKSSKMLDSYTLGEQLGEGAFAKVKKAKNKKAKHNGFPENVAIKIILKSKVDDMNDIENEIKVMQKLKHDHIVELYELFDEPKKMHLVMELVTGGELFDRIVERQSYTERDAAEVMHQMCSALDYMHAKKVMHRDLKPENVLYFDQDPNSKLLIADFGLSKIVKEGEIMRTACGTPNYVAPEVLKNKGYNDGVVDVWSTGVILYILLCGFPPFYEEELPALFEQIMDGRFDFPKPWWNGISAPAMDLVTKMLTVKPADRLTAKQVMEHPFCKAAPSNSLMGAKPALKKYNASRKMKKAVRGIMAQQNLASLASASKLAN